MQDIVSATKTRLEFEGFESSTGDAAISTKKKTRKGEGNHQRAAGSKSLSPQWLEDCNIIDQKKGSNQQIHDRFGTLNCSPLFKMFCQPMSKCRRFPDSQLAPGCPDPKVSRYTKQLMEEVGWPSTVVSMMIFFQSFIHPRVMQIFST